MKANSQALSETLQRREEILVSWRPAPEGWITINTDGSVVRDQHQAAAGGILRDHLGRRLACFAANLGDCTIMRAELRAAAIGFRIAWELGYRRVHLQMDSMTAVDAITAGEDSDGRHSLLLRLLQDWRSRDWEVRISHVFREANQVADLFAHLGHTLPLGTHLNCPTSQDIERCILGDCIGVAFPRICSHVN
ncbi:Putative ribonuclease H protein At1g65750 [Linum perenne]